MMGDGRQFGLHGPVLGPAQQALTDRAVDRRRVVAHMLRPGELDQRLRRIVVRRDIQQIKVTGMQLCQDLPGLGLSQ